MVDAAVARTTTEQEDIRELITALHQDRQAAKEKEKHDGWTKYVSLMIVVFAVAAAFGLLKAGGFSTKVMLNQAQASDTWAYYQAKTIKQRLAEIEAHGTTGQVALQAVADIERYRKEEKELQLKARGLEAARDEFSKHGPPLGFSIASLQISIALASVCLITKKKPLWLASAVLGVIGIAYLFYGLYGV